MSKYIRPTAQQIKRRSLAAQIEITKLALQPSSEVYAGLCETTFLVEKFFNYLEGKMDKKMAKVTKEMKTAARAIKKGKKNAAVKALKGAEKKNLKLTKIDREMRDPEIKEYKKMKQKGC